MAKKCWKNSSLEILLRIIREFVHVVGMCVQLTPSKDFAIPIKVTKFYVVLILHKKCTCLKLPATEGNLRQHFLEFFKKYGYV